jgi:hypothetical protein
MAQRFYQITGIRYLVCCEDELMYNNDRQLAPFRAAPGPWDCFIDFHGTKTLPMPTAASLYQDEHRRVYPLPEGIAVYIGGSKPYIRMELRGAQTTVLVRRDAVPNGITIPVVLEAMFLPKTLIQHGSYILHSSYIRYNGHGILFTAPSGVGKSTQAQLWETFRGAKVLNGDRSAVMPTESGVMLYGIPYCGSSRICENITSELSAIICLSQAPVTTITRLTGLQAFRQVWEGCTLDQWDRAEVTACTDLVLDTLRQVPVFHLACTPDETAVIAVEQAIPALR